MSDDMKKLLSMMEVMNARLTSMDEEIKSLKGNDKPEKEKVVKDTSFGGVFGHLFVNATGEPFRVKHSAEEKNGEDDEWYAVWDARAKVFAREGTDETYESPSQFGEAHNKSLLAEERLKRKTISCSGWDDVKYLNPLKKKWITLDTIRPEELKKTRSKSALKKTTETTDGMSIKAPKSRRKSTAIAASPKVMEAATSAAMSVVVPAVASAAINAHVKEFKNFPYINEKNKVIMVNTADDVENVLGNLNPKEEDFVRKNRKELFAALCERYGDNDNAPLTDDDVNKVLHEQMDG